MTAEEFYEWANGPGNEDRFFELERGRVVELPLGSKLHGFVCANVIGVMGGYVYETLRGYLCSNNAGMIVERDPDTVLAPDLSLFADRRTLDDRERGYSVTPPRLVIEVLAPHDGVTRTNWRIARFFEFGVDPPNSCDPEARAVSVYRGKRHRRCWRQRTS